MSAELDRLEAEAVAVAQAMVKDERSAWIAAAVAARVEELRSTLRRELDTALARVGVLEGDVARTEKAHAEEKAGMASRMAAHAEEKRVEREQMLAAMGALEQRVLAAVGENKIELPAPPEPVDLTPISTRLDALGGKLMGAIAAVSQRREIESIVPVRGGSDGLIQEAVVKYRGGHR